MVLHREFRIGHLDHLVAWHELARHGVTVTGPQLSTLGIWTDTHVLQAYTVDNLDTYWRTITDQLATSSADEPEAELDRATWPLSTVQTCAVHLIRAAMRFVSYTDRKKVAAALRPIYTAPTVEAAEAELLALGESELGRRYPAAVATWTTAWQRFVPFLARLSGGEQTGRHGRIVDCLPVESIQELLPERGRSPAGGHSR